MLKTHYILLLLCCSFSFLQAQNHGFQLRVQAGSNVGLYGSIVTKGSLQPKFRYGFGLQLTKQISKRFEIGIEKNIVKSQASGDYKASYRYQDYHFKAILYETKGTKYFEELFFQYPIFLRHKVGRKKRRYFEYGLDYKKMITNKNRSDLEKIEYFRPTGAPVYPYKYTEQDRLAVPIVSHEGSYYFSKNEKRLGLFLGFGSPIRIKDDFEINLVCRLNSSLTLLFEEHQNPYYQAFEVRVEFDVN